MVAAQKAGDVLTHRDAVGQSQAAQGLGVGEHHAAGGIKQHHGVADGADRRNQPITFLLPLPAVRHDAAREQVELVGELAQFIA